MCVSQGDVGYVVAPDMVAAFYFKVSKKVGVSLVSLAKSAQARLWVDGFYTIINMAKWKTGDTSVR